MCCLREDVLVLGCANATATAGQRNVYVSCELRARPSVQHLYWIIDDNGTTVAEAQVVNEYWTLLMVYLIRFLHAVGLLTFHLHVSSMVASHLGDTPTGQQKCE